MVIGLSVITDCMGHYNALLLINHNHNNFPKSESFIWKIPLRAILWRIGWKITHISHSISELKNYSPYLHVFTYINKNNNKLE